MLLPLQSIEYEPNESSHDDAGDHAGDPAGKIGTKYVERRRVPTTAGQRENQSRREACGNDVARRISFRSIHGWDFRDADCSRSPVR